MEKVAAACCGCDPGFVALRADLHYQYPELTPEYLEGVNLIFALACGLEDSGCLSRLQTRTAAAVRRWLQAAQPADDATDGSSAAAPSAPASEAAAPGDEAAPGVKAAEASVGVVQAAPGDEAAPEVEAASESAGGTAQACLDLQVNFGFTCQVGIDRVAASHFPRGSTRPPSDAEVAAAVQALQEGGLPSNRCCAGVAAVVPAGCGCEPAYVAQRAELQFQYPTLTPEYLAGVNLIFALACGLEDTGCL
ncbi:hypothetical protein C2E20_8336 [Micractinium conductrix]|uniref:Uncharacterized protein n=1 Tax=Micractinium conductrix TaxID=554055 RepID=A0A2P6V1S0_9CHLO|nr:hypothetical protein C2E20_8336 [Micractinium conductrix]|eukprot:PSC68025.1 hypothetical protein C2E20_8336 [Micractinium conductrix]